MRLFSDVSASILDPYLRRAWLLAENARGATSPNPLVGCVLVRDGVVVGEGWHAKAGEPHAEVMGLRSAEDRAAGSTAYVTLEPCAHEGRTPPCADALIRAGVSRVVIGMRDPNPRVVGGGAERLREAGIDVLFAEDPTPFEVQNEAWLHWLRTGRPFVQAKVALSLDGRPALRAGAPAAITGAGARRITMRLRAAADAVLVGAGTVRADDPALTVRGDAPVPRQPLRVVLAGREPLDPAARVFDGQAPSLALVAEDAEIASLAESGVGVARYRGGIGSALAVLGERDVVRLLVEPGPRLLTSLVGADAIDELVVYYAGGFAGPGAPDAYASDTAKELDTLQKRYRLLECGAAEDDAITVWRPAGPRTEGA